MEETDETGEAAETPVVETEVPKEGPSLGERASDLWDWITSHGNDLGTVAAILAIATFIVGLIAIPARRRAKKAEKDRAKRHEDELAHQRKLAEEAQKERARLEDKIDQLVERLVARETEAAGGELEAEAEATIREAATDLAERGGEKAEALERIAEGDASGFATLAQLAEAETSAFRQREAETEDQRRETAEFWTEIGDLAFMNHTQEALRAYEQARMLAPDDAHVVNRLGRVYSRLGRMDEAVDAYEEVLRIAGDDKTSQAVALGNLGLIAGTRGDLDAAEDFHKRSLAINEELGRKEGMASQLGNLGLIADTRGDLDAAEDFHKRSLTLNEELERKEGMAACLGNLGLIAHTRGDLDAAEDFHKRSLAIAEELGRKEGMANQLGNLGLIAGTRGDLDVAEDFHKRSLAIDEELGRKKGMSSTLGNLGLIARKRGDLDAACDYWRRAVVLYREIGAKPMEEKVSGLLREAGCDVPE